jgi:hypothetical protein
VLRSLDEHVGGLIHGGPAFDRAKLDLHGVCYRVTLKKRSRHRSGEFLAGTEENEGGHDKQDHASADGGHEPESDREGLTHSRRDPSRALFAAMES